MVADTPTRPVAETPRISTRPDDTGDRHAVLWPGVAVDDLFLDIDGKTQRAERLDAIGPVAEFRAPYAPLATLTLTGLDAEGRRRSHVIGPEPLARTGTDSLVRLGLSTGSARWGVQVQPRIEVMASARQGGRLDAGALSMSLEIQRAGQPPVRRPLHMLLPLIQPAIVQLHVVLERAEAEWSERQGPDISFPDLQADRALADPEAGLAFLTAEGRASLRRALTNVRRAVGPRLHAIRATLGEEAEYRAQAVWQNAAPALVAQALTIAEIARSGLMPETRIARLTPLMLGAGDRLRLVDLPEGVAVELCLPDGRVARADSAWVRIDGTALDWGHRPDDTAETRLTLAPPDPVPSRARWHDDVAALLTQADITVTTGPDFDADIARLQAAQDAPDWLASALTPREVAGTAEMALPAIWGDAALPDALHHRLVSLALARVTDHPLPALDEAVVSRLHSVAGALPAPSAEALLDRAAALGLATFDTAVALALVAMADGRGDALTQEPDALTRLAADLAEAAKRTRTPSDRKLGA
ncbi:hypothetical protein JI664_04470 [Rhodobacter sp. NTK016B]|uniref:hypothetical protein n=1 Tax=Rhodobacter sp. NTK016B TaxID=2759676 RepID=UPI001A8D48AE|nr:hypothetical protein [Rhodobacter sp. NTK016B]MBN8291211.1 hypothetical protein [Rhodobacter sp. NTK016B]